MTRLLNHILLNHRLNISNQSTVIDLRVDLKKPRTTLLFQLNYYYIKNPVKRRNYQLPNQNQWKEQGEQLLVLNSNAKGIHQVMLPQRRKRVLVLFQILVSTLPLHQQKIQCTLPQRKNSLHQLNKKILIIRHLKVYLSEFMDQRKSWQSRPLQFAIKI